MDPPLQSPSSPPLSAAAPVLEMAGVAVPALRRPDRVVLEDVDWSVRPGDFWAIGGLHASGKSDFMAVAAGLLPPARGTYRAFGREPITGFEEERVATRLRLGLALDGGLLLQHLTLAENISLPLRYHHARQSNPWEERLEELLDFTGLRPWKAYYPGGLSPSRLQRAGLARALALHPEVLLLDSPLRRLDPPETAWWLDMLGRLAAGHPVARHRPLTLVVTGDDLRPWRHRARQFAALKNRHLVSLPNRDEVIHDPNTLLEND